MGAKGEQEAAEKKNTFNRQIAVYCGIDTPQEKHNANCLGWAYIYVSSRAKEPSSYSYS